MMSKGYLIKVQSRDPYIYILDAVPHIHVVSNHVATDKLTTGNGRMFTVANYVKARQSLIERSELAELLLSK